jgi:hypoxanthine phosphoribosyltransferase
VTDARATDSPSRRRNRRRTAARSARARLAQDLTAVVAAPVLEESFPRFEIVLPPEIEPEEPLPDRPRPAFAHASEAEMARILDFYRIAWEYEPHTFPILWNLDGVVVESFSPDFWLPELDLYLEMTTLRQRLVRKKNRKLRRIQELYPDIRIKLFYARDFRALMLKFGRLALVAELSGSSGQVVPERPSGPDDETAADAGTVLSSPTVDEPGAGEPRATS